MVSTTMFFTNGLPISSYVDYCAMSLGISHDGATNVSCSLVRSRILVRTTFVSVPGTVRISEMIFVNNPRMGGRTGGAFVTADAGSWISGQISEFRTNFRVREQKFDPVLESSLK